MVNAPFNVIAWLAPGPKTNAPTVQLSVIVAIELAAIEALFIAKVFGHTLPLLVSVVVPLALVTREAVPDIPIVGERVTL